MSLRHALLGVLKDRPLTGYDLVRYFQGTLGFLWSAPQSQIYPELRRMESEGLVTATVKPRGNVHDDCLPGKDGVAFGRHGCRVVDHQQVPWLQVFRQVMEMA